jgi:hypothetical protein
VLVDGRVVYQSSYPCLRDRDPREGPECEYGGARDRDARERGCRA